MLDAKLLVTELERVLGFDYGTKKMGIASGVQLTGTASPITLLPMKDGIPQWEQIHQLITEYQPNGLIVGLPLNMDGTESDLSQRARKFARRLRHQAQLPVWMVDERLSSRAAVQLKHNTTSRHSTDAIAATLLIEQWYDNATPIQP